MYKKYLSDKDGITSTSANHLANLAKEHIKDAEAQLSGLQLYGSTIELINGNSKTLSKGATTLSNLQKLIEDIGTMNSFCAWVREAIKVKDELLAKAKNLTDEEYSLLSGKEHPDRVEPPIAITETDIISEMTVKERMNYLSLEAFAAVYGKYIHPDGAISEARNDYYYKLNHPTEVSGQGRDLIIYNYKESVPKEEVETVFNTLQGRHREFEKRLNSIKFKIKEEVTSRNLKQEQEYQKELQTYSIETKAFKSDKQKYILETCNQISALKIVIPESLKGTFEYLNSL
jgi:hypothetical protein